MCEISNDKWINDRVRQENIHNYNFMDLVLKKTKIIIHVYDTLNNGNL